VFLLASRETDPSDVLLTTEEPSELMEGHRGHPVGFYWTEGLRGLGWAIDSIPTLKGGSGVGIPSAPAIWMPDGMIGTPEIEDAERLQGFPAGWTKPAALVAPRGGYRWRLLGNAVTVDVARWIGARLHGRRNGGRLEEVRELHASDPWPSAAFGVPGIGRFAVQASSWPVARRRRTLSEFLRHDLVPLSERATLGFLSRLGRSRLLRPPEFDAALRKHAARMRRRPATPLASRANRVGGDPGGDGHTTGLARPA
jgi:DNA (cytosine-5)-methyltransferase 1